MNLEQNIKHITHIIEQTEKKCGRQPGEVVLVAVSKQQSAEKIAQAFDLGIHNFGENYYQEAISKIQILNKLPICWHYIGPIQSNKTPGIATHFDWVHSVNRAKIALALNEHRQMLLKPLNVCIQINMEPEPSKSGIKPEQALELATLIQELPYLNLRGLMTIPPADKTQEELLVLFSQLKQLMLSLNQQAGLSMDALSMGMSNDIVPAIEAGATMVRIGRAIFGERKI